MKDGDKKAEKLDILGMDEKDLRREVLELWRGSGKISRIKARGMSMEPLIKEGDEVIIKHSGVPGFGDIILFDGSEGLVVHRVIGKKIDKGQTYILEKGDSSPASTIIPEEKVLGIVIGIEKACSERSESNGKIIRLDSTLSKLVGKALAIYSLLSFKILLRYNIKPPRSLSVIFSFPRKFLAWIVKASKG